jgi:hypothetical protein
MSKRALTIEVTTNSEHKITIGKTSVRVTYREGVPTRLTIRKDYDNKNYDWIEYSDIEALKALLTETLKHLQPEADQ